MNLFVLMNLDGNWQSLILDFQAQRIQQFFIYCRYRSRCNNSRRTCSSSCCCFLLNRLLLLLLHTLFWNLFLFNFGLCLFRSFLNLDAFILIYFRGRHLIFTLFDIIVILWCWTVDFSTIFIIVVVLVSIIIIIILIMSFSWSVCLWLVIFETFTSLLIIWRLIVLLGTILIRFNMPSSSSLIGA